MQGYFGQRRQENREWSPNAGLVRTKEAGGVRIRAIRQGSGPREESECRAISDKGSRKTERWSPNRCLLRTKESAGKQKVSSNTCLVQTSEAKKTQSGVRMQG